MNDLEPNVFPENFQEVDREVIFLFYEALFFQEFQEILGKKYTSLVTKVNFVHLLAFSPIEQASFQTRKINFFLSSYGKHEPLT